MAGELVGTGCRRQCFVREISEATPGDACCPAGMSKTQDSDCASCGDGIVGPGETCDPPERCVSAQTCVAPGPCIVATLTGDPSHCNTRCELTPIIACGAADGCCPSRCEQNRDQDCSASCGDNIVDARVETCEPNSETQPCVADCDDADPCTDDLSAGSADNCNLSCTHTTISAPRDADSCCPSGATAVNDDDCAPTCGNGVPEPGEECDGGRGCDDGCRLLGDRQCLDALASIDTMTDACRQCACERCLNPVLACNESGNEESDAACRAVVECAHRTGCGNGSCYCGSRVECTAPDGVCKAEIEAAAGTTRPALVLACGTNMNCPTARAFAQDNCVERNCESVCSPAGDTIVER